MPIQVLPEQLASQIAAGEVVERPASVVKELVENALDAGATRVQVDSRGGGRQLIQVGDNGQGITAAELETAFLRHATSKLQAVDDLNHIRSLGFRGEALAAIAAVSRVTVVSRDAREQAGRRLTLEAGRVTSRENVGAPAGTLIAVENLFYNVPARLKFLKSVATERRQIDEYVTRYALAYPAVSFRLAHDGRLTFQTEGTGDAQDVLLSIYGPDVARQLLALGNGDDEAALEADAASVRGFVGPPSLHWSNRSHIVLFVNGRWIRDNSLTYAVIQAYHTFLPTGRYPLGIIFLTMPPELVDVNVHPTKTEVRFRHGRSPFGAVQKAVRQTLLEQSPLRAMSAWGGAGHDERPAGGWTGELTRHAFAGRSQEKPAELQLQWRRPALPPELNPAGGLATPASAGADGALAGEPEPGSEEVEPLPLMRVVGQIGAAYIIAEGPEGMYLIDQHAAHERILYEQFMADVERERVASQGLIAGTAVHLTPSQASLLEEHMDLLAQIGFRLEPFGPNAFMVRAVPAVLSKQDLARALAAVADDLEKGESPLRRPVEQQVVLRVCKSAAIKAGQTLSPAEMEALIGQLEACRNPHTCPHGRPTLIHVSAGQLARQFGRT